MTCTCTRKWNERMNELGRLIDRVRDLIQKVQELEARIEALEAP